MLAQLGFWRKRKYHLNKMTLRELNAAYFQYYAIQIYILLGIVSGVVAFHWAERPLAMVASIVLAIIVYPVVWYFLHRFVLHSQYLYRSPLTAKIWKRIHYDHHRDPYDLQVLFGALYTTLPTVAIVTIPLGWAVDGRAGAAVAFSAGTFVTCFYEYCHCIQHLSYKPRWKFLQRAKRLHVAHHFHNERGNFGITNYVCDYLLGTFYPNKEASVASETVFNLGYDADMAERYPWVADLSGGLGPDNPRERRQQAS